MELGAHEAEEEPLPLLPRDSFWGFSSISRDQGLGSVHYSVAMEAVCVWPIK